MSCKHKWIDYGMTPGFKEVIFWCKLCGALKLNKTMEPMDFNIIYPEKLITKKQANSSDDIGEFAKKVNLFNHMY